MNGVIFTRNYKSCKAAAAEAQKWEGFHKVVEEARGKADYLLIYTPEVLGDTYEEIVLNLLILADAGLMVMILPPSERAVQRGLF